MRVVKRRQEDEWRVENTIWKKVKYKDLPEDDPKRRMPNISLVKEKLNWKPNVNLENGLIETIKYFKNFLQWKI